MTGRLVAIARRGARRAPMEDIDAVAISVEAGLDGDHKGRKFPLRQVTILATEAWQATLSDLAADVDRASLPWTVRRANLLVEGVTLPRAKGGLLQVGPVHLEITNQTVPCRRMEEAQEGLFKAMYKDWRGGVTCRVISGGELVVGDAVEVLLSPPERRIRLPG